MAELQGHLAIPVTGGAGLNAYPHSPDGRGQREATPPRTAIGEGTRSAHDPCRTNSDIAHEISHIILEHPARTVERVGGINFFTCDAEEEQEANWLAGCLLLPRPLLVKEARTGATPQDLAKRHEVSEQMATWRLNASGVLVQLRCGRS
jgi:hypothetical protein